MARQFKWHEHIRTGKEVKPPGWPGYLGSIVPFVMLRVDLVVVGPVQDFR